LLRLSGHSPNLQTDTGDQKLTADQKYSFDYDAVAFNPHPEGGFSADHIKLLRLAFSSHGPKVLAQVKGVDKLLLVCQPLVQTMLQTYIRL
jgi:hypothetical protein